MRSVRSAILHLRRSRVPVLALLIGNLLSPALSHAFDIPELTRPVVDPTGVLDSNARTELERRLIDLHERGVFQMVIYLPRSLEGADIESYSMAVAEKWKLGKKGEDRGLLLTLAMGERRMRLEVGYGLEGILPDAIARRVLDETLRPRLRERNPALGLSETVTRLERIVSGDTTALPSAPTPRIELRPGQLSTAIAYFLLLLTLFLRFVWRLRHFGRRRYYGPVGSWSRNSWSGGGYGGFGGGGGGGYSGGGGGFGGGGASSGW